FYSGDHHIHAAGCAHYTSPTEGVLPEHMFRQVKGEGLNVGCVLTWGPCYRYQRQFFEPKPHDLSDEDTILKYDLEISGFGSQALGHVCLLNLRDQTYPGSDGTETKGWPTWTTPVMKWCKEQGGVTGYAHSASGIQIDPPKAAERMLARYDANKDGQLSRDEMKDVLLTEPFQQTDADRDGFVSLMELTAAHDRAADQLPNLAIPEMNGVGAMELAVSVSEGVCDFISAMDTERIQEWNSWYHVLNCGYPLKVSGETDFPCMSSRHVGQGRVYVRLRDNEPFTYANWCRGIAEGRSYVSDGYAHPLVFEVNGIAPGDGDVNLTATGKVQIKAKVAFAQETPLAIAYGTLTPAQGKRIVGDTRVLHGPRRDEEMLVGGDRLVELIANGLPVASERVPADGKEHDLAFDVAIDKSSWVALRHFPQFHTNPVNVLIAGKPIRVSKDSARWCIEAIDLLWKNREKNISPAEREAAKAAFERAKERYRQIAAEAAD
ncbi:MAG TPA: CehA/McbA family metallohydrolase, partial [Pirellulaceae bacterium]|nr:CehA/McbA family metallohydrolase [Pirellulaceae bacterium]